MNMQGLLICDPCQRSIAAVEKDVVRFGNQARATTVHSFAWSCPFGEGQSPSRLCGGGTPCRHVWFPARSQRLGRTCARVPGCRIGQPPAPPWPDTALWHNRRGLRRDARGSTESLSSQQRVGGGPSAGAVPKTALPLGEGRAPGCTRYTR